MAKAKNDLCTTVNLMLSARRLADKDFFSKSDPICVVFQPNSILSNQPHNDTSDFVEVGRTTKISNCLNPEWSDNIRINYFFEMKQPLRFEVYDVDCNSRDLTKHDFLGSTTCLLADIVAAPNSSLILSLKPSKKTSGQLIIRAEEEDNGKKKNLYAICHGRNLDKTNFFGKSNPFLQIVRHLPDGSRQLVYRTDVMKKTLNPEWKPIEILLQRLCNGNKDSEILIECYNYKTNGKHNLIGVCHTTVNILTNKQDLNLALINEKKKAKSNYKNSGTLHFLDIQLRREFTFLDFISAGLQLEFAIAIDFTASNGAINDEKSLHFTNPYSLNQYEMAIVALLDVCQPYNQSKCFEATGFGAKIAPNENVSHLFPLDYFEHSNSRTVTGLDGMLAAYRKALKTTQLFGPTNFSPTINDYIYKTRQFTKDASRYQILLIITDGIITDMEKTKAAVIEASSLPISIIIIGVGSEDFLKMKELDSDDQLLSLNGRTAKRDIVQFVPFLEFSKSIYSTNPAENSFLQTFLAKEVLAEVPDQITSYMKTNGISPLSKKVSQRFNPPPTFCPSNQLIESNPVLFELQNNVKSSAPSFDL